MLDSLTCKKHLFVGRIPMIMIVGMDDAKGVAEKKPIAR